MENKNIESNKLIHYNKEQIEDIFSIERQNPNSFYNYFKYKISSNQSLGQYLKNRVEFYNICKNSTNPQIQEELARDPYFHFFVQCQQEMDLAIPILQNCSNKCLTLQNCILSKAQCKALQISSQFFQGFVNQIYFDNCMISDKYFSKLLESLGLQKDFKSLIYKQNEFEIGSANQINALLKKKFPYNLEELKIENCKINQSATELLIRNLNDYSSLSKLALVNVSLNHQSIKILSQFLLYNKKIEYLDLSWNRVQPEFWGVLFTALKSNQVIQDFIFQQNQLVPKEIQSRENIMKNLELHKKIERKFKKKILKLKRQQKHGQNEQQISQLQQELKLALMNPDEVLICDCICDFIIFNPNICHINLQGCGLNYFLIKNIVDSVRKSFSLVGLHLSYNPGIDFEMKQYIIDKLHCKKSEFDEIRVTDLKTFEILRKYQQNMENEVEVSMKLKQIIQKEREELQQPLTTINHDDNICSITRYNGHQLDLRDRPGQWQINAKKNQECYICQKWVYSFVFLNPNRLQQLQTKIKTFKYCNIINQYQRKKMSEDEKFQDQIQNYLSQFIQNNNQLQSDKLKTETESRQYQFKFDAKYDNQGTFNDSNRIYTYDKFIQELKLNPNINNQFKINFVDYAKKQEKICLQASYTNWHQKDMINFLQFIENIDLKRPNIFENLKKQNLLRKEINEVQKMTLDEVQHFMNEVNKYRDNIKQNWQTILARNIKYLKPQILNLILDDLQNPENLFVFPTFIKHGKHHTLINVKNNLDQSYDWLFFSELVDLRSEDIYVYNKNIQKPLQLTKFVKKDSVFNKWKQENEDFILECLDHDFSLWNFRVTNYINFQDIDEIKQLISKHFIQIKEIFVYLQCISNVYPIINPDDLKLFLYKCDNDKKKNLNTQIIEKLFNDSLSDEEEEENQQDNIITQQKLKYMPRWSFLELIVRVALDKYQELKKKYRPVQMVEKYLNMHLLANKIQEQWQQMRDDYIWTNEVQNVFKDKIKMLYKLYFKYAINQPKRQMSINCCINLFIENCKLNLNYEEVKFCFAMSKMTIISDNLPNLYETVEFVEFIEIICRVADFQFRKTQNQTFQLHKKISFIIDLLEQIVESDDILNQDSQEFIFEKQIQQVYSDDEY